MKKPPDIANKVKFNAFNNIDVSFSESPVYGINTTNNIENIIKNRR